MPSFRLSFTHSLSLSDIYDRYWNRARVRLFASRINARAWSLRTFYLPFNTLLCSSCGRRVANDVRSTARFAVCRCCCCCVLEHSNVYQSKCERSSFCFCLICSLVSILPRLSTAFHIIHLYTALLRSLVYLFCVCGGHTPAHIRCICI